MRAIFSVRHYHSRTTVLAYDHPEQVHRPRRARQYSTRMHEGEMIGHQSDRSVLDNPETVSRPVRFNDTHNSNYFEITLQNCESKLREKGIDDKIIENILELEDKMICPLSLEIMKNPVFFENLPSRNQVRFEKSQILRVLSSSNPVHPITREPISIETMTEDKALCHKIIIKIGEIDLAVRQILDPIPEDQASSKLRIG